MRAETYATTPVPGRAAPPPTAAAPEATMQDIAQHPDAALDELRDRALDIKDRSATWIRENPTTALVGAVVLGFVFGRVVMR